MPRQRKTQVEECLILSAAWLQRTGAIRPGQQTGGTLTWRDGDGEIIGAMDYVVRWEDADGNPKGCMFLSEHLADLWLSRALLVPTVLPWGRMRWWFICQGGRCGYRRVGNLYLPLSVETSAFRCRHCHDLSYWTRQHAPRADRWLLRMAREREGA